MKKIALYGTFTSGMRSALYDRCPKGFEVYDAADTPDKLSEADYVICRGIEIDSVVLDAAKKIKLLQKWGAGYDKIDIAYAGGKGIPVAVCLGGNSVPVAELTVALMLNVMRNVVPLAVNLKDTGDWGKGSYLGRSFLLHGKTVGLIGMGKIAKQVVQIVRCGFGTKVIYYDIVRLSEEAEKAIGVSYMPLRELMGQADIVSIHIPLLDSTAGMIDHSMLEVMKPSAFLINTSRGGIVKEDDLIASLKEGKIMGAGLDTFAIEPPPKDSPLLHMDNVVATPHIGGNTADNDGNMAAICMNNIMRFDLTEECSMSAIVNKEFLHSS